MTPASAAIFVSTPSTLILALLLALVSWVSMATTPGAHGIAHEQDAVGAEGKRSGGHEVNFTRGKIHFGSVGFADARDHDGQGGCSADPQTLR